MLLNCNKKPNELHHGWQNEKYMTSFFYSSSTVLAEKKENILFLPWPKVHIKTTAMAYGQTQHLAACRLVGKTVISITSPPKHLLQQ